MNSKPPRLYHDLAPLWPLLNTPEDYIDEAETYLAGLQQYAERPIKQLLHLGCGGGFIDSHLTAHVHVTGLDLSRGMLAHAIPLNPTATYLRGDMRAIPLVASSFDAVLVADSVDYLVSEAELRQTFCGAWRVLRPGGALLVMIETYAEGFQQNETQALPGAPGEAHLVCIENLFDPDPTDTQIDYTLIYLLRHQGKLQVEVDQHQIGLFPLATWSGVLADCGFRVYHTTLLDEGETIPILVGLKPL